MRFELRTGLELGSYRTGEDSADSENTATHWKGVSLPAAGLVDGRGVVSRSPTLDDCRGGELIIMPSLANCEGGAGVDRTGDD